MTQTTAPRTFRATLTAHRAKAQEADFRRPDGRTLTCDTSILGDYTNLGTHLYLELDISTEGGPRPDRPRLLQAISHQAKHPALEVKDLRCAIRQHDHLYYNLDRPEISDLDYDLLIRRLTHLETAFPLFNDPHSPTQRVGGQPSEAFGQIRHPAPMLSLANAFNKDDFLAWHERVANHLGQTDFMMHLELKIDGLAFRAVYQGGDLAMAATRGDGNVGEDVTHTVRTVRNLPLSLFGAGTDMEIRGEVYMPRSVFHELNARKAELGEEPFANPRNAAAGALRQLDPKAASDRGLRAWVYSWPETHLHSQTAALESLTFLGLPVNPVRACARSPQQVFEFYERAIRERSEWDYDADGVVIKVDDLKHHETLGATGHEPRWAIAWKFPPEQVRTTLQRIEISHGRFGKLTPVAVLEPVRVAGVTVRSATLHNEQDIHRKDIREGAVVLLERAGDVIPKVTGPADQQANASLTKFRMPLHCPACGTPVTQEDGDAAHWCLNESCPAKLPEQLRHFVSKGAMDIDGLGPQWCEAFIERGLVTSPADLYHLTRSQLLSLPRMGEKLADRIINNLEGSKDQTLQRVLYSLGIFRLGREVSTILSQTFGSMDKILELSFQELNDIEGIGPTIAQSVTKGLASQKVSRTISTMRDHGVRALQPDSQEETRNHKETEAMNRPATPFTGKTVVVTGKLEHHSRTDAEAAISHMGGNPSSSVNKSTDYLVVGEKPGSKLAKANQLGVAVITDQEFQEMLEG